MYLMVKSGDIVSSNHLVANLIVYDVTYHISLVILTLNGVMSLLQIMNVQNIQMYKECAFWFNQDLRENQIHCLRWRVLYRI